MSPVRQLHRGFLHLRALPARYLAAIVAVHTIVILGLGTAVQSILDAAMTAAGISELTEITAIELTHSAASLALVIGLGVLVSVSTLAYAAVIVTVADLQLSGGTPTLRMLARRTLTTTRALGRPGSLVLVLVCVVIAPFAGFTLFSPLTASLALPPFIVREFVKTPLGTAGWALVIAILIYITFRTILALPLSVVAGTSPGRSLRTSMSATGRRGGSLALLLAITLGALWVISRVLTEVMAQIVDAAAFVLPTIEPAITGASLVLTLLQLLGAVYVALLLAGYARDLSAAGSGPAPVLSSAAARPAARPTPAIVHRRTRGARRSAFVGVAAALLVAITGVNVGHTSAAYASRAGDAIVIGHRGHDSGGAENTIESLESAVKFAPDFVEVDVQQTADGGFVSSHDSNLLILAGINKNIYDMTTAEVTSTTVRMHGNSGTIPTMAEFVTRAAQLEMPLLIEFKLNGHEKPDFVESALAELDALDALTSNTYQSTSAAVVTEIKRLHPELRVGFTIAMLRGDAPPIECDFYTLEQASYSSEFLEAAHAEGREVYLWTVNDSLTMRSLLRDGVDGLVTDQIDTARYFAARITSGTHYVPGDARDELLAGFTWD